MCVCVSECMVQRVWYRGWIANARYSHATRTLMATSERGIQGHAEEGWPAKSGEGPSCFPAAP